MKLRKLLIRIRRIWRQSIHWLGHHLWLLMNEHWLVLNRVLKLLVHIIRNFIWLFFNVFNWGFCYDIIFWSLFFSWNLFGWFWSPNHIYLWSHSRWRLLNLWWTVPRFFPFRDFLDISVFILDLYFMFFKGLLLLVVHFYLAAHLVNFVNNFLVWHFL